MLKVEALGPEGLEELLEMLRERAAWLESRGQPMWNPAYLEKDRFVERYRGPECFLAREDGRAVGGFVLVEEDPEIWPEGRGDRAFHVHKLVVRLGEGGKGHAGRLVSWIREFARARGKDFVRLDYYEDRECLARLYAGCGFRPVATWAAPDGTRLVKSELKP